MKRSSIRSYSGSDGSLPGLKDGDMLVAEAKACTTDYLICFTNLGNYCCLHVFDLTENKWKDEGTHINEFTTFASGEKIIKVMVINELRKDLYLGIVSKFGQIKRMSIGALDISIHRRPSKYMKLLSNDSIAGISLLTGNSNLLVVTNNGLCSLFNENEVTVVGAKAGGVKSISGLKSNSVVGLLAFEEGERSKIVLLTNKGHLRVTDINKFTRTARLGKVQTILQSFKGDQHNIVSVIKTSKNDELSLSLYLNDHTCTKIKINDLRNTEAQYAKKNINEITAKQQIGFVFDTEVIEVNKSIVSHPVETKKDEFFESKEVESDVNEPLELENNDNNDAEAEEEQKKEKTGFEQISIFDDLD